MWRKKKFGTDIWWFAIQLRTTPQQQLKLNGESAKNIMTTFAFPYVSYLLYVDKTFVMLPIFPPVLSILLPTVLILDGTLLSYRGTCSSLSYIAEHFIRMDSTCCVEFNEKLAESRMSLSLHNYLSVVLLIIWVGVLLCPWQPLKHTVSNICKFYPVEMPGESVKSMLSALRDTASNSSTFLARQVREAR